jgi:hypothetical protein
MIESRFPAGTPVRVRQIVEQQRGPINVEVFGVVEAWEELPTGSWYAHGKHDKLWLKRLRLRKVDGELTLLVIDDSTAIARLDAASN